MSDDRRPPDGGPLTRFLRAESGPLLFVRELLSSVLAVVLVGLVLFAVAGVWPPMVAVESGSMQPHMERGDLVFITEPTRFAPSFSYEETGVVTYETGTAEEYATFGEPGSVVVYKPPDEVGPPIIHRARFHVSAGENWYDRANPEYLTGDSCEEIPYCPAPHAGFITKGDWNGQYDQVNGIAPPVRTEWVQGVARVRVPYLGYIRLLFSGAISATPTPPVPVEPVDATNATAGAANTTAGSTNATVDAASGATPNASPTVRGGGTAPVAG
ncbi:S26 family signal peptidase [Candidatus Halobonum tyrrellensis]|uniref:Signal peptidase I n=1 Tax=Candidatus Halobonum tyrrellensis G22 TaxID=1324957 RepID=V4HCZ1_9EURY|nr:S26 family signal peptidase [Candidatus Halobonum tyrrellensis]ESP87928.1 hypothetical protein K933_11446 [Candidatus Halobonum tyrrellensis G22]